MPKINETDITNMGFFPEMFRKDTAGFSNLVSAHITRQEIILQGRIGDGNFSSVDTNVANLVKRAAECLVAAALLDVRITLKLSQASQGGADISAKHEADQRDRYKEEAEEAITRIVSGAGPETGGYAGGVIETDHFTVQTLLPGQEVNA